MNSRLAGSLALGLVAAIVLPVSAQADTTLGSSARPTGSAPNPCVANSVLAQDVDNSSQPYRVPGSGSITRWEMNTTGFAPGDTVTFLVLRSAGVGAYSVVGRSVGTLTTPLPPTGVATYTIPPIPTLGGETLGLYSSNGAGTCYWTFGQVPFPSQVTRLEAPADPQAGQTLSRAPGVNNGIQTMNLAATFVPTPAPAGGPAQATKCKKPKGKKPKGKKAKPAAKKRCKGKKKRK